MTNVNIEKMLETRVELLQSLQTSKIATDELLAGLDLVIEGGTEGIRETANMEGGSELIFSTIEHLVLVVKQQQTTIAETHESWFITQDALISVGETIAGITTQLPE